MSSVFYALYARLSAILNELLNGEANTLIVFSSI